MKIIKPTKDEYLLLRQMYINSDVITEFDLKDWLPKEKIDWLKKHKYISLVKDLDKCVVCNKPIVVGFTTCSPYHKKLWQRCKGAIQSKGQIVVGNGYEEHELIKNVINHIEKTKKIKLRLVLGNE